MLRFASSPVFSIESKLVINQLAPQYYCMYIYPSLRHFFLYLLKYTYSRIHAAKTLLAISNKPSSSWILNPQNSNQILSILQSETCFGFSKSKAFYSYLIINDPSLFFVRVFKNLLTFWTDLIVF